MFLYEINRLDLYDFVVVVVVVIELSCLDCHHVFLVSYYDLSLVICCLCFEVIPIT